MGKLVFDLKQLLSPTVAVLQGTVQSIVLDVLLLSSPNGPKQFKVANPGTYRKGDRVRFQGEVFLGKASDETEVPHYAV